ncbi:ATP-binding protein [Kitasatospora purpeofusca]|uniref:ATP-binding protein n=1 Tax=Kitasatospora purpeofusca TaxID=67352 RepID=UPI0036D2288B
MLAEDAIACVMRLRAISCEVHATPGDSTIRLSDHRQHHAFNSLCQEGETAMSSCLPSAPSLSSWLPRSRRSPGEARRLLENLLANAPGGERFIETGQLIVSELVTNAVLHGTPMGRQVQLVLSVDRRRLRIEVHDARGERGLVLRAAGGEDESGRGLAIVKLLAHRWGCCPREGGVGKIVWAEVESPVGRIR